VLLARYLGRQVEFPDRFQGVAEKVEAQGRLVGRGENVDDAALDGEMAEGLDPFFPGVAVGGQHRHDIVEGIIGSRLEADPLFLEEFPVGDPPQEGLHRGHHQGRLAPDEAVEGGDPIPLGRFRRRHELVGEGLPGREEEEVVLVHHGGQVKVRFVHLLVVFGHHDNLPVRFVEDGRGYKGKGGGGYSLDQETFSVPAPFSEGPSQFAEFIRLPEYVA